MNEPIIERDPSDPKHKEVNPVLKLALELGPLLVFFFATWCLLVVEWALCWVAVVLAWVVAAKAGPLSARARLATIRCFMRISKDGNGVPVRAAIIGAVAGDFP